MVKVINLYMDESGSRTPNINPAKEHSPKWFGMGGILFNEEDRATLEKLHSDFYLRHNISIDLPLHSYEIRNKCKNFDFLKNFSTNQYNNFIEDLSDTLTKIPVIGVACVIDQFGYHNRYQEKYREDIWQLCKTAFSICVERAVKYALLQNRKLRINVERSDERTDKMVKSYYTGIKNNGMPFSRKNMEKYNPLETKISRNFV